MLNSHRDESPHGDLGDSRRSDSDHRNDYPGLAVKRPKKFKPLPDLLDSPNRTIPHKYGKVYAKPLFFKSPYLGDNSPIFKKVLKPNPSLKLSKLRNEMVATKLRESSAPKATRDHSVDLEKTSDEKINQHKNYVVKHTMSSSAVQRPPYNSIQLPRVLLAAKSQSPEPARTPTIPQEPKWNKASHVKLDPVAARRSPVPEDHFYYVSCYH
jgi:hypothetical protein